MIIDVIKSHGVPFKCENCNSYFVWKPDKHGVCSVRNLHPKCKEIGCEYYTPAQKKCPQCGSDNLSEIPTFVYKIMRAVKWQ